MNKLILKSISVMIAAAIAVLSVSTAFASEVCGCSHTPIIFVAGFGATTLVEVQEDGTEKTVFPLMRSR